MPYIFRSMNKNIQLVIHPRLLRRVELLSENDAARRLNWPTKLLENSELKERHLAVELFNAIYVAK